MSPPDGRLGPREAIQTHKTNATINREVDGVMRIERQQKISNNQPWKRGENGIKIQQSLDIFVADHDKLNTQQPTEYAEKKRFNASDGGRRGAVMATQQSTEVDDIVIFCCAACIHHFVV